MKYILDEKDLILENISSVYFYANWMPQHKKMLTMFEKVFDKKINFFAIDTDYYKSLCRKFKVESIPTIIIFKDGNEIKRINGIILTSAFKNFYSDI